MFVGKVGDCYVIAEQKGVRSAPGVRYTYNPFEATRFSSEAETKKVLDFYLPAKETYQIIEHLFATNADEGKAVANGPITIDSGPTEAQAKGLDADENNLTSMISSWAKRQGQVAEAHALQSAIFDLQKHLAALKRSL